MSKVLVVYHSGTGNTKAMAQTVAEGVKEVAGVEAVLKEAEQVSCQFWSALPSFQKFGR